MKISKINKEMYKLSQTLYGVERFKLIIESIKQFEKQGGDYTADDLPQIDTDFKTMKEREEYRKIILDFYVVNLVIVPMLLDNYQVCLASVLAFNGEDGHEESMRMALERTSNFFKLLVVLEEIGKQYDCDLVTYLNRHDLTKASEFLSDYNRMFSFRLGLQSENKISSFNEDEMKSTRALIKTIFDAFHWVAVINTPE